MGGGNSPKRKSVEIVEHVFQKVEGLAEGIGQAKGQVKDKVKDVTPTIAKEGLKQVKEGTRQVKEGAKEGLAQVKEQVEGMTPTLAKEGVAYVKDGAKEGLTQMKDGVKGGYKNVKKNVKKITPSVARIRAAWECNEVDETPTTKFPVESILYFPMRSSDLKNETLNLTVANRKGAVLWQFDVSVADVLNAQGMVLSGKSSSENDVDVVHEVSVLGLSAVDSTVDEKSPKKKL